MYVCMYVRMYVCKFLQKTAKNVRIGLLYFLYMFTINGPRFVVMCIFLLKTDLGLSELHGSQRDCCLWEKDNERNKICCW
jgi:hypothetical protein